MSLQVQEGDRAALSTVCSTASSSVQRLAAALESSVQSQGSVLQGIEEQVADFKSRKQQVRQTTDVLLNLPS